MNDVTHIRSKTPPTPNNGHFFLNRKNLKVYVFGQNRALVIVNLEIFLGF